MAQTQSREVSVVFQGITIQDFNVDLHINMGFVKKIRQFDKLSVT